MLRSYLFSAAKSLSHRPTLVFGSLSTGVAGLTTYQLHEYWQTNKLKQEVLTVEQDILHVTANNQKKFEPSLPKYDLSCVGGSDEILDNLEDVIRFLQDPEAYKKTVGKPINGVILSGPPGVGKTMIAEAVAGHAGVSLFMISGSEFKHPYVGGTEQLLRDLFEEANLHAPCVICIDEIDSIGSKRVEMPGQAVDYYINSVVNQMLSLMTQKNDKIIVIGTTNDYARLDPALVRAGRFDRHIYVALPDQVDREKIISVHLRDKLLSSDVDIIQLAKLSRGYSGAKIASWLNEAAICASREGSKTITADHISKANSVAQHGIAGKPHTNPDMKRRTAIHEAGHAFVAHLLGKQLYKVSIIKHGNSNGMTEFIPTLDESSVTREQALNEICIALAGRASEEVFSVVQVGSKNDIDKAIDMARAMVEDGMGTTISRITASADVEIILNRELLRAKKLIEANKNQMVLVVNALVKYDELTSADMLEILQGKRFDKPVKDHEMKKATSSAQFGWFGNRSENSVRNKTRIESKLFTIKVSDSNDSAAAGSKKPVSQSLPFTIEEVAKVLDIDAAVIRKITKLWDGYTIAFKPSFKDADKLEQIVIMLTRNDVESFAATHHNPMVLEIRKEGVADFIKLVERLNSNQNRRKP